MKVHWIRSYYHRNPCVICFSFCFLLPAVCAVDVTWTIACHDTHVTFKRVQIWQIKYIFYIYNKQKNHSKQFVWRRWFEQPVHAAAEGREGHPKWKKQVSGESLRLLQTRPPLWFSTGAEQLVVLINSELLTSIWELRLCPHSTEVWWAAYTAAASVGCTSRQYY